MVTPREQKEMVLTFNTKNEFVEAFVKKYSSSMPFHQLAARTKSLWQCRVKHAQEINKLKAQEEVKNHTVMIPARIVSKHAPSRDAVPDIGETLVRTNHLLAELVQLQKEQFALFKEMKEVKK